jgi:hypothetical protein
MMAVTSLRPPPMPDSVWRGLRPSTCAARRSAVHAEDLGDEERGLVAAGAGAELEDDVLLVVGVFGQQQDFELFFDSSRRGSSVGELFLRHLAHVGVGFGEHGLGSAMPCFLRIAVLAETFRRWASILRLKQKPYERSSNPKMRSGEDGASQSPPEYLRLEDA